MSALAFLLPDPTTALVVFLIIDIPLIVGGARVILRSGRNFYLLQRRGYLALRERRAPVSYQERVDGQTRRLLIAATKTPAGVYSVVIPSDAEWRATAPPWARDRKGEIVGRIKQDLGGKDYDFLEE